MSEYRKTIMAVLGVIATALTFALDGGDVIPDSWTKYIVLLVNLLAAYGVFAVRNVRKTAAARRDAPGNHLG